MPRGTKQATRRQILDAAGSLFYRQGVQRSGVDELAAAAGRTKPTLYSLFGSKERLLDEVLRERLEGRRRQLEGLMEGRSAPLDKLRTLLEAHRMACDSEGFRGCPLVLAVHELPDAESPRAIALEHRTWLQTRLATLAGAAGLKRPKQLARRLVLLVDGAGVLATLERSGAAGRDASEAAEALIELHGGGKAQTRRRR